MPGLSLTVRELRRRWKPTKERLQRTGATHPLAVRLHRSFSWLAAAEKQADTCVDTALLFRWTALNALYGCWDTKLNEPQPDGRSLQEFLN